MLQLSILQNRKYILHAPKKKTKPWDMSCLRMTLQISDAGNHFASLSICQCFSVTSQFKVPYAFPSEKVCSSLCQHPVAVIFDASIILQNHSYLAIQTAFPSQV